MSSQGTVDIPGFVDLQVNGFAGVDFSSPSLTKDALESACRRLIAAGTVAFLPTLITCPVGVYARNLPLIAGLAEEPEFAGHILGIHLEGPFISATPGAVGAHDPELVQPANVDLLNQLLAWGQGQVRLLTLAAELPGVEEPARLATGSGVTVSVGHALFTAEDLDRLHRAGARALTHLGNGLPNLLPRHPNPVWDGLADERYTALVIADGHHLSDAVLRVMVRARRGGTLAVVSDAAPVAGLPPGEYDVLGNAAVLEPSGRLYSPEKDCLVGSSATMLQCMNHLAALHVCSAEELLDAGFYTPLRVIGVSPSAVRGIPGQRVVHTDGQFHLVTS